MKHPNRSTIVAALVIVVAAAGTTIALTASGGRRSRPQAHSLGWLQSRIERDAGYLARRGILVESTGQGETRDQRPCVYVGLVNPTEPNVVFVRRRFGAPLCFERVWGAARACADTFITPGGRRRAVPDLVGLGIVAAQARARKAGFSVALTCAGQADGPLRPSRLSAAYSARVTAQCPRPETKASVRIPISLEATAYLPGKFTYTLSGFDGPPRCRSQRSR